MRIEPKRNYLRRGRIGGFSIIELLIVLFVVMVIAAIAIPNILVLDRHAGHTVNRERRTAAGIAIELRQDHTGEPDTLVEAARDFHGVPGRSSHPRPAVLLSAVRDFERAQLIHHFGIDLQPAGRIDDHRPCPRDSASRSASCTSFTTLPVSRFPNTGTSICRPSCSSCSAAAGR